MVVWFGRFWLLLWLGWVSVGLRFVGLGFDL